VTAVKGDNPLALDLSIVAEVETPTDTDLEPVESLAAFVLAAEGAVGPWDVTIALVSDDRLQALHREFMGIDEPTDIMTFPGDAAPGAPAGGELVISVDHARTQAAAWGLTPAEEIRFLVVHGLLHLLGWRDDSDEQRQAMLQRQEELIARWRAREASRA
jgi:probable rRNA maturation factor